MQDPKASKETIVSGYRSEDGETIHVLRPIMTGGRLEAAKFLQLATIAETWGDRTLRLTSRQGIEVPGIKASSFQGASQAFDGYGFASSQFLAGSIRNITLPSCPAVSPLITALEEMAGRIVEKFGLLAEELPQKLKIGLGTIEDNQTDILVNDIAIVATETDFLLLLGGGAGGLPETGSGARLATVVCTMSSDQVLPLIDATISIFRREAAGRDRAEARLKHIFADKGADWFRNEIGAALGTELEPAALPSFGTRELLGWHEQGDSRLWLGFPMLSGRIADIEDRQMMSGFKAIAAQFALNMILTSDQNILLCNIDPGDKPAISDLLRKFGCWTSEQLTPVSAMEMTCPGAPVCRLAAAGAESIRHQLIYELESVMDEFYVRDIPLKLRIAGCARGCSRPYTGEIGIVGEGEDNYAIYLGGLADGSVLGDRRAEHISAADLPHILEPVIELYSEECETGEPFGAFIRRTSRDEIAELIAGAIESRKIAWAL